MLIKSPIWATLIMFISACLGPEVSNASTSVVQTVTLTPSLEPIPLPLPTLTPLLPSPTVTVATEVYPQSPMERLTFTAATDVGGMFPDTIISLVNSDGTDIEFPNLFEPFRYTGGVSGKNLAWSPDGRFLAFDGADKMIDCGILNTDCASTNYGTFLADYSQGIIIQRIESTLTNSSWSPDSQTLVVAVEEKPSSLDEVRSLAGDLFLLKIENSQLTQLTNHASSDLYPAWSPNGQWIAFIRFNPDIPGCNPLPLIVIGNVECNQGSLYIIHPNGSGLRFLFEPIFIYNNVEGRIIDNAPVWSPDSKWLTVLVSNEKDFQDYPDIATISVETGELRLIVNDSGADFSPAWSPDGQHLAFVSNRNGNEEIYIIDSGGQNISNLTLKSTNDYYPVWSPSGTHIAFISDYKLQIMNADGRDKVLVDDEYQIVLSKPSWLPITQP